MRRALFLAERGRGTTSPNPLVGAVIVSTAGVVVGQGAHAHAGGPHAEIVALDAAGDRARGATLYCTLEPCCHTGRTGPCVERIAAAGIARVVAAMEDPDPRVRGGGFRYLRERGIDVSVGECEADARALNAAFLTWIEKGRPHVTLKTVVSADGFVGPGDRPLRLTGPDADAWFHRQRAEVDAIAVGANTVLVDDPRLTARLVHRARPLTRVIVDWRLRLGTDRQVFATLDHGPVLVVTLAASRAATGARAASLEAMGVRIETFETRDLAPVLRWLGTQNILSLLVEGGPELQSALLQAGLVDRVQRAIAPITLSRGVPAPVLPPPCTSATLATIAFGEDVIEQWDLS